MSTGSTGSPFPKWQLAVLLGAPIAIGLGYMLYRRQTAIGADGKPKKKSLADLKDKSISIDGGDEVSAEGGTLGRRKKQQELENQNVAPLKQALMYKDEGNTCYRRGKYDEAIKFYDKAIDKCPLENKTDLAIFYQNRAAAYEMLKKWSHVKEDCTKSLQYNPKYAKAYFRRAKAHEQTNNLLESLDDVTATCILEVFQNTNTITFADRVLKQTGYNDAMEGMRTRVPVLPSKSFIKTFFRSFVCDPLKAMSINVNVEQPKGYIRAKLAWDMEKYDDIIPACTEEIESSESESQYKTEAWLLRGTFNLLCGCFAEAQQDFEAVIKNADAEKNVRVNALIKRGSLHVQNDQKEIGMADFQEAERLDPTNADIYYQRAQIYTLLDQLELAISEYERTIKLAPEHGMAYVQKCYASYRLAFMSQDQMRLMSVMNDFKNAVERYPDCTECYSLMAQVLSDQGQYDQSDSFFEKAMKMSPDNAALYVHRGLMQLQWNGDVITSIDYMNKAIEIDEKCELAYETLGTIEVQRANLEKAIELFEKAIKYAKSQTEMAHLYALRNAAIAQRNVTQTLGIDMTSISALASAGLAGPN